MASNLSSVQSFIMEFVQRASRIGREMNATKLTLSSGLEPTKGYVTSGDSLTLPQIISATWVVPHGRTLEDFPRDCSLHQPAYRAWYHRESEIVTLPLWISTSKSSETTFTWSFILIQV